MSFRTTSLFLQVPKTFHALQRQFCHRKPPLTSPHNLTFHVVKKFSHKPLKCWQCGIERKNIGELFCDQCCYIQAPTETSNYFKLLEFDENFDVDQKVLTARYRQLQKQLHPDKFTNKSNKEKDISAEFSSLVNKAYQTLQTPLKRAIHLLYLKGESIKEDGKVEDPEFLMEIMELNEEVEDADTEKKLKNLKTKSDSRLSNITKEIQCHFDNNNIAKAKESIIKMKYYNSVSLHINSLMREKGIVE